MINLFKMDFHRFIRNKILYALLLIYSAFQIFGIFMFSLNEGHMAEAGIQIGSMNASEFIQFVLSQPPSWMLLYIMVFTVYFYMSELNSGYYKNYITIKNARIYSVLSKIIIQALFTLFMLVMLIISDFVGRSLFLENSMIGDLGYFMKLLFCQFLLQWSFSILMLSVTILTKKILVSLIIGFLLVLNIFGVIISSLETALLGKAYVSNYLLVNTITRIKDFNDQSELIVVLGVGLSSIIIFIAIATSYKLKEDLK